jgi:hypothetical protein
MNNLEDDALRIMNLEEKIDYSSKEFQTQFVICH